jgi:hypothetical protein
MPGSQASLQQKSLVGLQMPLRQSLSSSQPAPLARLPKQVPPSQCAPLVQTSPAQQACPIPPQQVNPAPPQAIPVAHCSLQQKPLTVLQKPVTQSLFSSQATPFARSPWQTPSSQWALPTQWSSVSQVVRQAVGPQT